jgi:hypothetical protein
MKIAVLSEFTADEEAVHVLVKGVLGIQVEPVHHGYQARTGGWAPTINLASNAIRRLYYGTDAEGFVITVDSDTSPIHTSDHEVAGQQNPKCRLCQIKEKVDFTLNGLAPVRGRVPFRVAIGMAVPAIEAWYRCGQDGRVCEAIWQRVLRDKERTIQRIP